MIGEEQAQHPSNSSIGGGYIAEDYTFDNLRRCAQDFASYLLKHGKKDEWVIVGHDRRFHSENFARTMAEVLTANQLSVYLTDGATPTPVIAFAVVNKKACGAVNITASHNPSSENGGTRWVKVTI